tara:strand:- start:2753 stop:3385 length:633 start_codon:yes stop_codon:yes gene_type:complete
MNESRHIKSQSSGEVAQILQTLSRLYAKHDYEAITMEMVEKNLNGLDLYKHFGSKEELFLHLLMQDIIDWITAVRESFDDGPYTVEEFASKWTQLVTNRMRLFRLLTLLYVVLEKNVSVDSLTWFRLSYKDELTSMCSYLSKVLPFMNPVQAEEFLYFQVALGNGLQAMTNLSPKHLQAFENANACSLNGLFEERFKSAISNYLKGITSQ